MLLVVVTFPCIDALGRIIGKLMKSTNGFEELLSCLSEEQSSIQPHRTMIVLFDSSKLRAQCVKPSVHFGRQWRHKPIGISPINSIKKLNLL